MLTGRLVTSIGNGYRARLIFINIFVVTVQLRLGRRRILRVILFENGFPCSKICRKFIYEPWEAPIEVQRKCGVVIGETYPHPIVDHKVICKSNMGRMQGAYDAQKNGNPMPEPPSIRTDATLPSQDSKPAKKKQKK
jgi:FAD binding domain of DNA photolyase